MPGSTTAKSPRNCNVSLIPMSERQQMKLVRQLETCDGYGGNSGNAIQHRPRPRNCNGRGETPLHKAAIKGDQELVIKLLEEGADPNIPDFAGWTPLHEACNHGWYGVALALVQAGASVNATGFDDDTPLHDAAINGHSKLVKLLVERGADVHFRNKGGKTPCDVAAPGLIPDILTSTHSVEKNELGNKFDVRIKVAAPENDLTAISGRRSTSSQTKVDKSSRVTLRLNPLKKKSGKLKFEDIKLGEDKRNQYFVSMDEKNCKEDVYEFKSSKEATPVRGNSTSPEVDKNSADSKNEKSGDGCTGTETESVATKRTLSEVGDAEEVEDDNKKRKRKDKEGDSKEVGNLSKTLTSAGRVNAVRNANSNNEKGSKVGGHLIGKNCGGNSTKSVLTTSTSNLNSDRKSPSSPKASATVSNNSAASNNNNKSEPEQEDGKASSDGEKMDQAPKVPPLKIVIPQQTASEPEQGNRNGKNSASRHHQALPYVVTTNSNDGEKEGQRSRSASPTDSFKSEEKKDPAIGMLSAEDQKNSLHHQRVLRSSHRAGPVGSGESRTQESAAPRNNNGNGQSSNVSSGTSLTTASNSNNANSGATSLLVDNLSPPSQNRTSPLPQGDSNACNTLSGVSASTDGSSSNLNSNYRPSTTVPTKNNVGSTSATLTVASEDKAADCNSESTQVPGQQTASTPAPVELHPRKRKLKHNKEVKESPPPQATTERCESATTSTEVHPHEQPVKNCYQLFLDIRKQIERRRKGLFPVQPKPPQGFKDYLMNRCTYVLAGNASTRQIPSSPLPQNISSPMKDLFVEQEKERHRLRLQHVIEKEKLVLSVEQEILRVHGRAARALANQSLPFSACTILKDEEVYNLITPEQEEKDRNARSRYNGRLFLSWLQDVDDKWEKIKEAMLLRHHNEAESLHAVQKMDWEWKMKELGFCEFKSKPVIHDNHVPMVHVSDDFDLLPA